MLIELEDYKPYYQSFVWGLHNQVYEDINIFDWRERQIPFSITSNYQAARQKAELIIESIILSPPSSEEKIYIMELGSGLGIFALNFIKAFTNICIQKDLSYHTQLHYMMTDYQINIAQQLSEHPEFQPLIAKNILGLYQMDCTNPQSLKNLEGQAIELNLNQFNGIIANYVHCTLPVHILYWNDQNLREKWSQFRLEILNILDSDPVETIETLIQTFLVQNQDIPGYLSALEKLPISDQVLLKELQDIPDKIPIALSEASFFKDIDIEQVISSPSEQAVIEAICEKFPEASFIYCPQSCKSIERFLPHLKEHGLYLISDKGTDALWQLKGERDWKPVFHGNTLSFSVNFPLLAEYTRKIGGSAIHTEWYYNDLHTLMLMKSTTAFEEMALHFKSLYIQNNFNLDAHDFIVAADEYSEKERIDKAIIFYLKALKHRINDAELIYDLVACLINQQDFDHALQYLNLHKDDYYDWFDFDFQRGQICFFKEQFDQAIEAYDLSLKNKGENEATFYNLGLCWIYKKNYIIALNYLEKTLKINPSNELVEDLLTSMQESSHDMITHIGSYASYYYELGYSHELLKDEDKALKYYEKALELDSSIEGLSRRYQNLLVSSD